MNARGITDNALAELLSTKHYNVMDSRLSIIRPPEVCAVERERLTWYPKSSAEHYR